MKIKTLDTVKVFREIKEKIAKETENMTFEQFKEYLNKKSREFRNEQEALLPTNL